LWGWRWTPTDLTTWTCRTPSTGVEGGLKQLLCSAYVVWYHHQESRDWVGDMQNAKYKVGQAAQQWPDVSQQRSRFMPCKGLPDDGPS
jgi:hypothetical protein